MLAMILGLSFLFSSSPWQQDSNRQQKHQQQCRVLRDGREGCAVARQQRCWGCLQGLLLLPSPVRLLLMQLPDTCDMFDRHAC
jgi:hypothetical protein